MKTWIKRTILGAVVFALVLGGAFFGVKTSDNAIFAGNAEVEIQSPQDGAGGDVGSVSLLSANGEDADTELQSPESQAGEDGGDQSAEGQAGADSGSGGNSVAGDQNLEGDQAGVDGGDQSPAADQAGVFSGDDENSNATGAEDASDDTDAEKDSQNPAEDASELDAAEGENADDSNPVNNSQNPEDQTEIDDNNDNSADSDDSDTENTAGENRRENRRKNKSTDSAESTDTYALSTFATVKEVLSDSVSDSEPEKQNLLEKDAQDDVETDLKALISKVNLYAVRTYASGDGTGTSADPINMGSVGTISQESVQVLTGEDTDGNDVWTDINDTSVSSLTEDEQVKIVFVYQLDADDKNNDLPRYYTLDFSSVLKGVAVANGSGNLYESNLYVGYWSITDGVLTVVVENDEWYIKESRGFEVDLTGNIKALGNIAEEGTKQEVGFASDQGSYSTYPVYYDESSLSVNKSVDYNTTYDAEGNRTNTYTVTITAVGGMMTLGEISDYFYNNDWQTSPDSLGEDEKVGWPGEDETGTITVVGVNTNGATGENGEALAGLVYSIEQTSGNSPLTSSTTLSNGFSDLSGLILYKGQSITIQYTVAVPDGAYGDGEGNSTNYYNNITVSYTNNQSSEGSASAQCQVLYTKPYVSKSGTVVSSTEGDSNYDSGYTNSTKGETTAIRWTVTVNMGDFSSSDTNGFSSVWGTVSDEISSGGGYLVGSGSSSSTDPGPYILYPSTSSSGGGGNGTTTIDLSGLTWTSSDDGKTWTLTYYTPLDTSSMSKVTGTTITNSITLTASESYKSKYGTISGSGSATYTPSITAPTITKSCDEKNATASASAAESATSNGDTVSVVDWTIVVSDIDSSFTTLTLTEDPQSCTDWSSWTGSGYTTSAQTITGITVTVGGNTWEFDLSTTSGGGGGNNGNTVTGVLTSDSTDYNSESTEPPSGGTGTITYTPPAENSSAGTLTFSSDWLEAYITAANPAENIITITVTTEIDDVWAGYTYYNYATVDYGFAVGNDGEPDTGSRSANATYRESESKGVTKTGTQAGTNRIHYQVGVDLQEIMTVDETGNADGVEGSYTFIFTDELPTGLTLDESTLDASFCGNGYYPTCDHVGTTTFWTSSEKKVTLAVAAEVDESSTDTDGNYSTIIFTVTISGDVKDLMEANGTASEWSPTAALTLSYDVIITDEDAMNEANKNANRTTEKQYTNTVSVSYYTDNAESAAQVGDKAVDSQLYTVTDNRVTKCIANTDPNASLIEGADYSIYTAPYARYTVTLNPDGLKLCEGESTTYTATDVLGSDLEFVDVTDKNSSLSEHQKEELRPVFTVDGVEYSGITYEYVRTEDGNTVNKVVFENIPDETAVTITYWVKVLVTDYENPLENYDVGNTFSIGGEDGNASDSYDISSDYEYALEAESSAWSATRSIKLYKFWVDESGDTKSLAGSTFEVYSAGFADGVITESETPYVSGITVGEDGVATISGLYDNVLYVLYEVSSDEGYARRSDPYYFVVGDTDVDSDNWPTGTHLWSDNTNHEAYDYDYENVKAGTLTLIKEIKSSEPLSGNLRELAENVNFAVYITSDSTSTGTTTGSGSGSSEGESNWKEGGSAPNYGEDGILVGEYNVAKDFDYTGYTVTDKDGNEVDTSSGSDTGSGDTGTDTPYTYTYTFTKTLDDLVPGTYKVVESAGGSEVYEIKSVTYTYTVPPANDNETTGTGPDTGDTEPDDEQNNEPITCTAEGITVNEATSEYPDGTVVTFANTYGIVTTSGDTGNTGDTGDTGNSIGELVITKTISGDAVSEEELEGALQFTVTRARGTETDAAQGESEWEFTLADFDKGTETTDSEGTVTATYTLTIKDVPNENTYTVRETLYDVKGYSCEVTYEISGQSNDTGDTGSGDGDSSEYGEVTRDVNSQYVRANIVSGATTNVNITDNYTKSETAGVLKITKTIGGVGTAVTEEELKGALTFTVTNRSTDTAETYTLADFTKVADKNGNAIYDGSGNKNSGIDESAAGVYELELPEEPGGYRVEETLYDIKGYACTVTYTTETVTGSETRTNNNWGSTAPTVVIDSASTTATVNITDEYVENGRLVIQKTIKGPVTYDEYKGDLKFTVTNNDTKESATYTIANDFTKIQGGKDGESVTYVKTLDLTPGGYTVEETVWQLENYVGSVSYVVDGASKGSQNASVNVKSKSTDTDGTTVAITDEYAVETYASELTKGTLLITKTIKGDVTEEELKDGSLTFEVTKDGTPVEGSPFTLNDFTEVIPLKYYTKELEASLGTYHVVEKLKTPEGKTVSTSYTVTGTGEDGEETSESSENRKNGIDAVFAESRSSGVKVDITNSYTEIEEAEAEESTNIVAEQKGDLLITKTIEGEVTAEELAGALVFTVTNESGSIAGTYTLEDFERTENGRYEKTLALVTGGYTVTESMYSVDGFVGSVTYNVGGKEEEGKEPGVTEVLGGETAEAQIRDDYTEIPEDYGKLLIEKSIEGPVTDEDVAGALVFNITRNETGESKNYTLKDFVKTGNGRYTLELAAVAGGYTVRETEYGVDGYSCTVSYQAGAVDADGMEADALAEEDRANVTVTAGGTGTVLIQNAYTAQAVMSSNDSKTQDKNTKAQAKTTKKVTKSAKTETETATANASDTVSTGDTTPIRLLVTVMLVCAAGIVVVLIYRKKRVVPVRYKGKWEKNSR